MPSSMPQRIALVLPFEEMDGTGPEKAKPRAVTDVGVVEILPLALNE